MNQTMKLGTAKIDITPEEAIPLAGYEHRTGTYKGVTRPLYLRVLLFQQDEPSGEKRYALLVSADLIWWGSEHVASILKKLEREIGLKEVAVILHATHNHSGPQMTDRFIPSLGQFHPGYITFIEAKLFEGVRQAMMSLEPVSIDRGVGECRIGVHRRKFTNGRIIMAPNPHGPVDPEVNVIRFRAASGQTKALLVHYACHPTTTDENCISSEFPGVAMSYLENALGGNTVAAFLQGCCGDIRPSLVRRGSFYRGSDEEVRAFGTELANQVLLCLNGEMQTVHPSALASKTIKVPLSFQKLPSVTDLEQSLDRPGVIGEWARLLLTEPDRIRPAIELDLTLLRLSHDLSFLAMNGEIVTEYGLFVKREFANRVLPVAYSNGMIGYVPTTEQVLEGGYEGRDSSMYFGLPAPFDASIGMKICQSIMQFVGKEDKQGYDCQSEYPRRQCTY